TALSGIVAAVTVVAVASAVRLLRHAVVPSFGKIQAVLVPTSAVALTAVMLTFWVPVSWRSSGGGVDRVAKRIHDSGIFVQSTLVVYDTFSTSGRAALINE